LSCLRAEDHDLLPIDRIQQGAKSGSDTYRTIVVARCLTITNDQRRDDMLA
jgi:hypothetical protein